MAVVEHVAASSVAGSSESMGSGRGTAAVGAVFEDMADEWDVDEGNVASTTAEGAVSAAGCGGSRITLAGSIGFRSSGLTSTRSPPVWNSTYKRRVKRPIATILTLA